MWTASMQLQQAEARGRQVADECLQQRNQVEADKTEIGKLRASSGTEASSEQLRAKLTDCQVRVAEIGEKRNSARRVLQRSTEDIAQSQTVSVSPRLNTKLASRAGTAQPGDHR